MNPSTQDLPDDSLHVGIEIPRHAARQIHLWARSQHWPEGTQLEPPSEYHITLFFAHHGHQDHSDAWWLEHLDQVPAKISDISTFPARHRPEGGYAYILLIESPQIDQKAEEMMSRGEAMGLDVSRHPSGFKAHITVGYGPTSHLAGIKPPNFEFDVGPSSVSPRRISSTASRIAYDPEHVKVLDHLSLSSVAHNLHYRFEQKGGLASNDAVDYAQQLLKLIGYPTDDLNVQAALQSWQQLYPQDKVLDAAPQVQQIESASRADMDTSLPPGIPVYEHTCGQGFLNNGGGGWTPIDMKPGGFVQYGLRTWSCPNCQADLRKGEEFPRPVGYGPEKFADTRKALSQTLRYSYPQRLYHWLDASDIHDWMDPSHTGPGHTFLTESGDINQWNDDVPHFDNPVRLSIDTSYLDHNQFDQGYNGWLGNHLYHGPIHPDAVAEVKSFKRPDEWDNWSTIPTEVNSPDDRWPEFGDVPPDRAHDIQFSNDWTVQSSWDPTVCSRCGGAMGEPHQMGRHWVNVCTNCKSTRDVPYSSPLLKQYKQQQQLDPYPELLDQVGPKRPWIFAYKA